MRCMVSFYTQISISGVGIPEVHAATEAKLPQAAGIVSAIGMCDTFKT